MRALEPTSVCLILVLIRGVKHIHLAWNETEVDFQKSKLTRLTRDMCEVFSIVGPALALRTLKFFSHELGGQRYGAR